MIEGNIMNVHQVEMGGRGDLPSTAGREAVAGSIPITSQKVDKLFSRVINVDFIINVIKKGAQLARRTLKVAVVKISKFQPKMLKAIAYLGLLQLINIAEFLQKYPSNIKNFLKNLSMHDIEGMVFSGLSLIINPLDALDSVITFCESASALTAFPVITAFSVIALPIAITLLGFATVKGIYDLICTGIAKSQLPAEVKTMDDILKLKADLEKKLSITESEKKKIEQKYAGNLEKIAKKIEILKTNKINAVVRHTDQKIMHVMSNLLDQLEKDTSNFKKTNEALSDIHTLMTRKITVNTVGTLANAAMLVGVAASTALTLGAFTIPVIALVRTAIHAGKELYMNEFYTKGLYAPEMTKAVSA